MLVRPGIRIFMTIKLLRVRGVFFLFLLLLLLFFFNSSHRTRMPLEASSVVRYRCYRCYRRDFTTCKEGTRFSRIFALTWRSLPESTSASAAEIQQLLSLDDSWQFSLISPAFFGFRHSLFFSIRSYDLVKVRVTNNKALRPI